MTPKTFRRFAKAYEEYGRYTMVADENYFVTVLKNSPFCNRHENKNFLHVQFDKWENEKASTNNNKCLQPNPQHCGRSPTTLTLEYLPVLDLGGALFARKFDSRHDSRILAAIDARRLESDEGLAVKEAPRTFEHVRIGRRVDGTEYCTTVGHELCRYHYF